MSCPQSESVANHRSSATPIKNRQFFAKVFYLSVFCKVVFGEIKSNRRILRFLRAFHHPVLFRALVRRFFAAERTYPFPKTLSPFRCCAQCLSSIFSACRRVFPFCAAIYASVTLRRHHLARSAGPSDHSRASCAQSPKQPAFPAAPPCARRFPPPFSRTAHRRIPCGHSRFGTSAPEPSSYGESNT